MKYRIVGIDTETTGLDPDKGHKIIEIGLNMFETVDGKTFRKMGKTWTRRVNPKRPIDAAAQAVHGISAEDLVGCPTFEEVAPTLLKLLKAANLLVAHNANFDVPFIVYELASVGLECPELEVFCTMESGRPATALGKLPNLGELCWAMDVSYNPDEAHAADYDIDKTMECFFRGVGRGLFSVPHMLDFFEKQKKAA